MITLWMKFGTQINTCILLTLLVVTLPTMIIYAIHHLMLVQDYRAKCIEVDDLKKQLGVCPRGGPCDQ